MMYEQIVLVGFAIVLAAVFKMAYNAVEQRENAWTAKPYTKKNSG